MRRRAMAEEFGKSEIDCKASSIQGHGKSPLSAQSFHVGQASGWTSSMCIGSEDLSRLCHQTVILASSRNRTGLQVDDGLSSHWSKKTALGMMPKIAPPRRVRYP